MKARKRTTAAAALFATTAIVLSACSSGSLSGASSSSSSSESSSSSSSSAAGGSSAGNGAGSSSASSAPASSSGSAAGSAATSGGTDAGGITIGKSGTQSEIEDISKFCGTKPIKVAYADGSGNNAWRQITKILFETEAKKCKNITAVQYTDAQNNTQKAISDFNSLVAQGFNVIVTFADSGQALLPTIKKATAAGVKVVPIVSGVGGTPGKDYVDFVAEDVKTYGFNLAVWTMEHMGGKGNLVMLGGTAGNQYSQTVFDGVNEALKKYPNVKLLNTDGPVNTDWTVSQTQQAVAGLITKYGTINGVVSDYGGGSAGGVQAFVNAGKPVPVWSANDSNAFACLWKQYTASQPSYQIATESSRNWVVEVALHKALAAYNGLPNAEPDTFNLQIIEDSTDQAKQPKCDPALSPDAILSSGLSAAQLKQYFPAN